jgi:RND family efflux transporter MFP subunit
MEVPQKRLLLLSGAALACILVVVVLIVSQKSPHVQTADASSPRTAAVAIAKRRPLSNQLSIAGEFLPFQDVQIHAKVAGYIRKINVDIGDRVHQGQVLAVLEIPELVAQVDEARAAVHHAEEEIQRAHSEVSRAEADGVALHANAQRLEQTDKARPGLIAQQELDDATAKDRASQAQVDAAKSALAAAKQQLEVAKANYQHYSALGDYAQITAPYDGVVTARFADTGSLVQAGTSGSAQPVVTLAQVNVLRLRVPVPESLVPAVHDGESADVLVSATGEHFLGKVVRATDALDRATRTMQVEIDVPNPKYKLSPGMYAQVTLHTDEQADALSIPVLAVHRSGEKASVMLVDAQNRVQPRDITTGVEDPNYVQVSTGLKEGDRVILVNAGVYEPNELVSPKESSVSTNAATGQGGSE